MCHYRLANKVAKGPIHPIRDYPWEMFTNKLTITNYKNNTEYTLVNIRLRK